jgi:hypothetical protein
MVRHRFEAGANWRESGKWSRINKMAQVEKLKRKLAIELLPKSNYGKRE